MFSKEKQFEILRHTSKEIESKLLARDWVSLNTLLDKFHKQFLKAQQTDARIQSNSKLFVRSIVRLATEVNALSREQDFKKQMSSIHAKAFNSLNQRLKKFLKDFDKTEISFAEKFWQTPEHLVSDSDAESADPTGKNATSAEGREKPIQDIMSMAKEDVTFEMIDSKLRDITSSRGKKGVDRSQAVDQLAYLSSISKCPAQECEVILHIISAQFDVAGSMATHMAIPIWRSCLRNVLTVMRLLSLNEHISLTDEEEPTQRPSIDDIMNGARIQLSGSLSAFAERLDDEYIKSLQFIDPHSRDYILRIQDEGLLIILLNEVSNLYQSKMKAAQATSLSSRILEHIYYKQSTMYEALRAYVESKARGLESKYHEDSMIDRGAEPILDAVGDTCHQCFDSYFDGLKFPHLDLFTQVKELTTYIYRKGDERAKARALLCQIFSKALHGDYENAKDLLLMSHLQESITHMDISTQILFNRTVAQMGICAFQHGRFSDASSFLSDLFSGGRTRELLAQGFAQSRFVERSPEQEKLERRRQMPHHLHLNLDLLEAMYLVCAMLFEISDLLRSKQSKYFTRLFMRVIENYNRQLFTGPPDGIRDAVMAVTRMLLLGEYEEASNLLRDLPVWNFLSRPKLEVLQLVDERLKIEGLRLFLSHFAEQYASASGDVLSDMFCLFEPTILSTVNGMVANEQVPAVFDELSRTLIFNRSEHSRLQLASAVFSEKVLVLLDNSERALDQHVGVESSGSHEEDELVSRSRRSAKIQIEPEEYRSRRMKVELGNKAGRVTDPFERSRTKARDSYGNFSRRKVKEYAVRGGSKLFQPRDEAFEQNDYAT